MIFSLLLGFQAGAQKVGLVLSGGGAKGMAHIGVIRVLEENNIPIDYIAGTSIGAIVGGLYAAGYSPDEMEELFKSDDFYFWSTGKIQQDYRYYFKMPEETPSWLTLNLEKKESKLKVLPPTNFIPQQQMDFAFMELLSATNAACKYNFDNLMVPFFCVATDVNNSKPIILKKGDLGAAIRASMTVPLVFKPIEIDSVLLFDGGVLNNFPHDIMTEIFKPDIIIGHQVVEGNKTANSDDLMTQIEKLVMRPSNYEIKAEEGILLKTPLKNMGLLDWNKTDMAIIEGMRTAYQNLDSIKNLVNRRVSRESVREKRKNFKAEMPELYFQNIQVEGVKDPEQRKFIIQSIKGNEDVISLAELKKEYFRLVADEHIRSIMPVSKYNEKTGYFDLHLKVEQQSNVKVDVGGHISTKPINQGFASLTYNTYKRRAYSFNSNIYFGRFYSSFKAGARIDYPASIPFYLSGFITLNRWDYFSSSSELFFEDVRPPYIIQYENNTRFEIGFPLKQHNKLIGGLSFSNSTDEYYQTEVVNKGDVPDETSFKSVCTMTGLEYNSLNYKQYATEGANRYLSVKYIVGTEKLTPGTTSPAQKTTNKNHNYIQLEAHTNRYFRLGNKFATGLLGEAVFSNKSDFSNFRSSKLAAPGFYPTPHSKSIFIENFHSNSYFAGGASIIFSIIPNLDLRTEGYAFLPVKELVKDDDGSTSHASFIGNYYLQGLTALVYKTGAGPVSLSVSYYEKPDTKYYLMLSFGYIIFNKRGF